MLRGIYTAAAGMQNTQIKQDANANNIANAGTTGYKQDRVVAKPFPEVMLQVQEDTGTGGLEKKNIGPMTFGVTQGEVYTDFSQGGFEETGSDLDFAINGRGFFEIRSFDGIREVTKYTRDGSFKLDSEGRLVNVEGGFLMALDIASGLVGTANIGEGNISVDSSGIITVDNVEKYRVQIRDFVDYNNLVKEGKNIYAPPGEDAIPVEAEGYEVLQGKVEQSNIDISNEMVSMITNLRSYQANQKVLQSIDETLGKAVNEIGSLR